MNRQVRVDSFPSGSEVTQVTGRSGHLISTEKIMSKAYDGILYTHEKVDSDFDYDNEVNPGGPRNRPAHLTESVFMQTDEPIVNKSIHSLKFKPLTCDNDIQTFPSEQASMLPYLCEDRCRRNAFYDKGYYIHTGEWTDMDGEDVDAPDHAVHYRYHPHEQGQLFLNLEDNDEKYEEHIEDDENGIFNLPTRQIRPTYANGGPTNPDDGLRFTLIANADNANPGVANVASGLSYFDMEHDADLDVFRTELQNYELKIGVDYLSLVLDNIPHNQIAGEMRLPLQFNLQLSFDVNGMAVTKAISFNGDDISDRVTIGGFYEMVLYEEGMEWTPETKSPTYTTFHTDQYIEDKANKAVILGGLELGLGGYDRAGYIQAIQTDLAVGGGHPNAQALVDFNVGVNGQVLNNVDISLLPNYPARIVLYLPIRRYAQNQKTLLRK